MTLTPGREIDYEAVRTTLLAVREEFDVRSVGYDAWGSKYLAEQLQADGVPLLLYRMGIATFGPGCNLFQNLWAGSRLVVGDDPVLRRACAEAHAKRTRTGTSARSSRASIARSTRSSPRSSRAMCGAARARAATKRKYKFHFLARRLV
jgi:phage terminase large subunit-like protein